MKKIIFFLCLIGIYLIVSCENGNHTTNDNNNLEDSLSTDSLVNIVVFYTNDEHGWMEPTTDYDGAAGLMNML